MSKDKPEVNEEINPEKLFDSLLKSGSKRPKEWNLLSHEAKLEFIATRMLAEDRHGTTKHSEIKDSGILSVSQYERRLAREVSSNYFDLGGLDNQDVPITTGIFGRAHKKSTRKGRGGEIDE